MSAETAEVTFTRNGALRGVSRGAGFAFGVLVYGIAFGVVADQLNLSTMQAVLFSALVFSGSAQLAAIGVMSAGLSGIATLAWTVLVLILVINARYVLFSATMRPWLSQISPWKAYATLFFLGDGSWMLSQRAYEQGERDAGYVFGASVVSCFTWLIGTFIGSVAGGLAPDPRVLGFDFLLAAFSIAMMLSMLRGRTDFVVLLVAMGVAALLFWLGQPALAPVIAGFAGGAVAYFRFSGDAHGLD
ncbi:AzlC Predicted branched-chain amino acid permease (azaleucine resistance) [Rhabdaerophilaceae bacterium]